jgi:hypothetical protein
MQERKGTTLRVLLPSGLLILGVVAAALAGVIRLELREGLFDEAPVPAAPVKQEPSPPPASASHERSKDQDDGHVATILARPLFSPTRRPPAPPPAPEHVPELARLSGVILSPAGKRAIFAGRGGGKPVVVEEGARIGEYVVRSIDVDAVTMTGPGGERTLNPVFDPNPPKPVIIAPRTPLPAPVPKLLPGKLYEPSVSPR